MDDGGRKEKARKGLSLDFYNDWNNHPPSLRMRRASGGEKRKHRNSHCYTSTMIGIITPLRSACAELRGAGEGNTGTAIVILLQ